MSLCVNGDVFNIADLEQHMPGWHADARRDHVTLTVQITTSTRRPRESATLAAAAHECKAREHDLGALMADAPSDDADEKAAVDAVIENHAAQMSRLLHKEYEFARTTETRTYEIPWGRVIKFEDGMTIFASLHQIETGVVAVQQSNKQHISYLQIGAAPHTVDVSDLHISSVAFDPDAGIIFYSATDPRNNTYFNRSIWVSPDRHASRIASAIRVGCHVYCITSDHIHRIGPDDCSDRTYDTEIPPAARLHTDGTSVYLRSGSRLYKLSRQRLVLLRNNLPEFSTMAMWPGGICGVAGRDVYVIGAGGTHISSLDNTGDGRWRAHPSNKFIPYQVIALLATPDGPRMIVAERIDDRKQCVHIRVFRDGKWHRGPDIEREDNFSRDLSVWFDAPSGDIFVCGRFDIRFAGDGAYFNSLHALPGTSAQTW